MRDESCVETGTGSFGRLGAALGRERESLLWLWWCACYEMMIKLIWPLIFPKLCHHFEYYYYIGLVFPTVFLVFHLE